MIDERALPPAPLTARPPDASTAAAHFLRVREAGLQRRGRWLFRRLSFDLVGGELLAITGPSGAGKSSLLACLSGALNLDEGGIVPRGFSGPPRPAWVYQDLQLVPQATLLANVLMARLCRYPWWQTLWSFPPEERRDAWRALAEFGLADLALRPARETSGGEQQRTAVARALFAEAPLLFADEPVANLNEELAERVLERLRHEARARGAAVVCVLHHEDQVRRFADVALRLDPDRPDGAHWERLA